MASSQTETAQGAAKEPAADSLREESNAHILEAAYSIAQLHSEHHRSATPHERTIDRTTGILGKPWFILLLTVVIAGWQAANFGAPYFGVPPIDPPPFSLLATAVSLASFSVMLLILATQRRENRLAERREQLTLELALLSEKKAAKAIELLEELRRDFPLVQDRVDEQARAMAKPADPKQVLQAIVETHAEAVDTLD